MAIALSRSFCYEALPGENKMWFDRYVFYREMPYEPVYEHRNMKFLATAVWFHEQASISPLNLDIEGLRAYLKENVPKYPSKAMKDKSKQFRWEERCRVYDILRRRDDQMEREAKEREIKQKYGKYANKLLDRVDDMLAHPIFERVMSKDGKTIVLKPSKFTARDIPAFIRQANELHRFAYGIRDHQVSEIEAVQVLVELGVLPPETVDATAEGLDLLRLKIRETLTPEVMNEIAIASQGNDESSGGDSSGGEQGQANNLGTQRK